MLRNIKDLRGYKICATDGIIVEVDDLYFDDDNWAIRYLVVDTGHWLSGRKVLISPLAVGHVDWVVQQLAVSLTKAQVEGSPDIDTRKPVSRQHEAAYAGYYGYPYYWAGMDLTGMGTYTASLVDALSVDENGKTRRPPSTPASDDCHLRSCRAVTGYHVHATDGDIGHVEDLLADDYTWAIRYLIVATSNWGGGHRVLVAPQWIEAVSWADAKVSVDLTREAIRGAPPYDSTAQIERQLEQGIYEHYGRPGYWITRDVTGAATLSTK
jgi:hypothetical protein